MLFSILVCLNKVVSLCLSSLKTRLLIDSSVSLWGMHLNRLCIIIGFARCALYDMQKAPASVYVIEAFSKNSI